MVREVALWVVLSLLLRRGWSIVVRWAVFFVTVIIIDVVLDEFVDTYIHVKGQLYKHRDKQTQDVKLRR